MPWISEASPLETYNSLADRHLVHFFRSARMRKHLIKSGLVTESGEIRPESEYREITNREEQKRALLEIIAHAIVERSLEAERIRQGNIRRTLEEICKLHRVKRIRDERQRHSEETILMQLLPRDHIKPEKLQPTGRSPHENVPTKERALVVPVSDIDEPELAVMDKHSQIEVAKAQRVRRQRKSRERNAGQPPYLYLWEPGIQRRNISCERGRSKVRGGERKEQGLLSKSRHSGSREGRFNQAGQNGIGDRNVKGEKSRQKKTSGFDDRLIYDDPQTQLSAGRNLASEQCDRTELRSQTSSLSRSPNSCERSTVDITCKHRTTTRNILPEKILEKRIQSLMKGDLPQKWSNKTNDQKRNVGCETLQRLPTTCIPALMFSTGRPVKGVLIESLTNRKDSKCLVCRPKFPHSLPRPDKGKLRTEMFAEVEKRWLPQSKFCDTSVGTTASITSQGEQSGKYTFAGNDIYGNDKISLISNGIMRNEGTTTEHLLPPILDKSDLVKSPCVVRLMYLGATKYEEVHFKKSSCGTESQISQPFRARVLDGDTLATRYITVVQQPNGGNTVTVFKGYLQPGDQFEFTSRRNYGYPFSLSLCIDGTQDARVSTCCEYRHRRGVRIGGKAGHFVYLSVEGSIPCFKCQAAKSLRHERQKQLKKKQTKYKDTQEFEVVNDRVSMFSGCESNVNEQLGLAESVPSSELKLLDTGEEKSAKADGFTNDFQPVCTNLNRRVAKSTMWECFTPTNAELQMNLAHLDETLTGDSASKSLQYGIEQTIEAFSSQPLKPISLSLHQSTLLSGPDRHDLCSTDLAPSNECTGEQEYEMAYEIQDEDRYSEDADGGDSNEEEIDGDAVGKIEVEAEIQTEQEPEPMGEIEDEYEDAINNEQDSDRYKEFEVFDHVMIQGGAGSRTYTDSKQSIRDIVVEKVDTVYQHRMSSVCRMHMVDSSQVVEVKTQHPCGNFGELLEENVAGDRVEKMTNFVIFCTDHAEETPVQEYSIVETRGTESSCASGDQQNLDVMWLSGYTQIQHQTSTPKDVDSRIPLIVVDSDTVDNRFIPIDPKGEWHTGFDQTPYGVLETVSSKHSSSTKSDIITEERELASACLTSVPLSPRSMSRTAASRSVTFASSMSQCKTPIKVPSLSPDDESYQIIDWEDINMEIPKAGSKASTLATETTEFFSVHLSPKLARAKSCDGQVYDGSVTTGHCIREGFISNGNLSELAETFHKISVYSGPCEAAMQSLEGFTCTVEEVKYIYEDFSHEFRALDTEPMFQSQTISRSVLPELQRLATDELIRTTTEFDPDSAGPIQVDEQSVLSRCLEDSSAVRSTFGISL